MDTEDRLDALEARAKKNSIIIGTIIVLVILISIDLKLHKMVLRLFGLDKNADANANTTKSGFDACQLGALPCGTTGLVKDYNGDIMGDLKMHP
jgi:hypothetical protein